MPIMRDIPLRLKISEVLRREGIREYSKLKPEIKDLIRELLATVNDARLLEPAIAYEIHSITEMRHDQLCLQGNAALYSPLLPSLLPEAEELAIVVCTIGPRLEQEVKDYFDKDEPLRGLLLDGIGSAAIDALTQEICRFMMYEASSRGYQASSPLGPGMPGFPITEQGQIMNLVPAREIGVSLTPTGIMVPQKSASMVIGIGTRMTTWTQAEICGRCSLRKTCPYRIQA